MRKKIIAGLLLSTMIFSLTACGSDEKTNTSNESTEQVVDTVQTDKAESDKEDENKTAVEPTNEEVEQEVEPQEWIQAYIDYLNTLSGDEINFCMAYINDDEIPDLISECYSDFGFYEYDLFSYHDGDIYRELPYGGGGSISYIEKSSKIKIKESLDEYRLETIYELKFDGLASSTKIDDYISSVSASGQYYYDENGEHEWNHELCTKEEYEKKSNEIFDASTEKYLYPNLSISEMKSNLQTLKSAYDNGVPEWKQAYLNYIMLGSMYGTDYFEYGLINIDGDDIPELFCWGGGTAEGMHLISFYDGEVFDSYLPLGGLYYLEGENKVYVSAGRMDNYTDNVYHLEKGLLVSDISGWFGLENNSVIVDENGNPIPYTYKWDDKEVSEQEYKSLLGEAFDKSIAKSASGQYTKSEFTPILSSAY